MQSPPPPDGADSRTELGDVEALSSQLSGAAVPKRIEAAASLGRLGSAALLSCEALLSAATEDEEALVREWSIWALGEIAASADDALSKRIETRITDALFEADSSLRRAGFRALLQLPPTPSLLARARTARASRPEHHEEYMRCVEHCAASVDEAITLLLAMQSIHDESAERALAALCRLQPERMAVFARNAQPREQETLVGYLVHVAPERIVDLLIRRITDKRASCRAIAVTGLGRAPCTPDVIRAVTRGLVDPDATVRQCACAHVGEDLLAQPSIRVSLRRCLRDDSVEVQREATLAVGRSLDALGASSDSFQILDCLVANLLAADLQLACFSAWTLEKLGPDAKPALDALHRVAESASPTLSRSALAAIAAIRETNQVRSQNSHN